METPYKSKYYEILFDAGNSLIVHKALSEIVRVTDEEFKQEMLIFCKCAKNISPKKTWQI